MKLTQLLESEVKLDTASGKDKARVIKSAQEQGIDILDPGTGTYTIVLDLDHTSLKAAMFISRLWDIGVKFDDVSDRGNT